MLALTMSTSKNSKVSEAECERFKEIIRSLWETHTLSEMMKIMADDRNFHAT
jgi:transposase